MRVTDVAYEKLERRCGKPEFYNAEIGVARFYFDHLLPRSRGHAASMVRSSKVMARLPIDSFVFE